MRARAAMVRSDSLTLETGTLQPTSVAVAANGSFALVGCTDGSVRLASLLHREPGALVVLGQLVSRGLNNSLLVTISIADDCGAAFGTGEHPTTRLCLGWLRDNAEVCVRDKHVVDFGTGSGVIAIGALLMGAAKATGVDVDPLSVKSARRNARLNGIDETRLALFCADGSDGSDLPPDCDDAVDCVVANILVGPVTQLAPLFAGYAKRGVGRVCVSGVLATQVPTVRDAYGRWFDDLTYTEEGGWAVVSGVRNSTPAP